MTHPSRTPSSFRRRAPALALALLLPLGLAACGEGAEGDSVAVGAGNSVNSPNSGGAQAGASSQAQAPSRTPRFHFEDESEVSDAELANYHVVLHCAVDGKDVGAMTFRLWPEKAPKTVRNFLRYCDEGFYDGTTFHRILRSFMIQGGSPDGTGAGEGPHGRIPGEFTYDPKYRHRYGVLSMARSRDPNSASSQFFVICDDSPSTAGLDGQYASFGELVDGVATLEAIADVPTKASRPGGEPSTPLKRAVVTRAEVVEGPAPEPTETIARPRDPNAPQPRIVEVQHVLISFADVPRVGAKRSKAEAEALAQEVFEKAKAGADFTELVKQYSDDPVRPGDPMPGIYRLEDEGAVDYAGAEIIRAINAEKFERVEPLQRMLDEGKLTRQQFQDMVQKVADELRWEERIAPLRKTVPRRDFVPGFADLAFRLEPGEVALLPYDPETSPFGWHVIKRLD